MPPITMTFPPVVERELRVASRRWTTYWGRAVVALGASLTGIFILTVLELFQIGSGRNPGGVPLFWGLGGLSLVVAAAAGMTFTSDAVSKERREGTLGLLFLTDLRGWDVAFGKLASSSLGAFSCLIAIQPIMFMALLLGGITGGEYARMCLVLAITGAASLSIGLFASTCAANSRTPPVLAFLLGLALMGLFPLAGLLLQITASEAGLASASVQPYVDVLYRLSPVRAFLDCSALTYQSHPWYFWLPSLFTAAVGLSALGITVWRLPRVWQDRSSQRANRRKGGGNSPSPRTAALNEILERNPIAWLNARQKFRTWIPWTLGLVYIGAVGTFLYLHFIFATLTGGSIMITSVSGLLGMIGFLFQVWIANEAGRQLLEDRRTGAIELQLGTPLTVEQIVHGHLLALWRVARWPAILMLLGMLANGMLTTSGTMQGLMGISTLVQRLLAAMSTAAFMAGTWALALTSLDGALSARHGRIALRALFLIIILPAIAGMFLTPILAVSLASRLTTHPGRFVLLSGGGSALLSLSNALFWGLMARQRLLNQFRLLATVPLDSASLKWNTVPPVKAPPPLPRPAR